MNARTPTRLALVAALACAAMSLSGCALLVPLLGQHDDAADAQATVDLYGAAVAAWDYALDKGELPTRADQLTEYDFVPSSAVTDLHLLVGDDGFTLCVDVTSRSGAVLKEIDSGEVLQGACTDADVN